MIRKSEFIEKVGVTGRVRSDRLTESLRRPHHVTIDIFTLRNAVRLARLPVRDLMVASG